METQHDSAPPPGLLQRLPPWLTPLILVAALLGLLTALGSFGGADGTTAETTSPVVDATLFVDPLETAVAVVEEFGAAWTSGDVARIEALIAEDWVSISLPGFQDPSFRPEDGREALHGGLAFLVPLTDLTLGPCEAGDAADASAADAVVRCHEALFTGAYLDAVRRDAYENLLPEGGVSGEVTLPGMWFGVDGDRIIALDDGDPHRYASEAYCIWAEATHPDVTDGLFDLSCRPTVVDATAPIHRELAIGYVAAGAPLPPYEQLSGRLSAMTVNRFATYHNAGEAAIAAILLGDAVPSSALPGFAGADLETDPAAYLAWSAILMRLELGWCRVAYQETTTTVTCPDLMVTGPLAEATGQDPLPQPTRFTVERGNLAAIETLGDETFDTMAICRRLRRLRPVTAAATFTGDCTPIYTETAAELLLTMFAGGYTAEG